MEVGRIETPIYEEANGVMFKMSLYKVFSLASRAKRGEAVAWEEISAMLTLTLGSVQQIRQEIPTHPSDRYNLLVPYEFFANGELEKHRAKYGDRFDIDWVSGPSPEIFITNVRAKASGRETKTVVLVPSYLPTKQLEELTKIGIRFVRVNTRELLSARSDKPEDRERFQVDTYAMMILLRRVDDSITAESSIYRLLSFYLRTHFNFSDKIAIDDYIQAITKSDIGKLILGILAYRPAKAYDVPEYKNVAASLISA
jgi:hypothetical protein